ncbi:uncharacterized protein LOC117345036 isoform X2 [Pecten maximus]|uniref:uncharacterized protein LOC117345036 isoform X2 n=1 Tax=Pecten maximus TaxID=6579 RepID=UPI00145806D6|nr:uncharacterized protein LOC117345036 isoform X2 [Pecten maximus]
MSEFVTNVLWLVLSPLAGITGVITAIVISHYTPFHHGSDILFFSYVITMSINGLLLPAIPALVQITGNTWPDGLCQFYVWASICFRVLQVLTMLSLSVLWSAILKYSTKGKRIRFTTIVKGVVPTVWAISAVLGLLPIIGAVPQTFHSEGKCYFLSSDLGQGMGVVMGVLVFSCVVFSVICVCDATILLKYVRRVALVKYGAGRFYLPQKRSSVPGAGTYTIHERYHQLTFAWDVCRLVLAWVLSSGLVSHIPYAVLEFVALTSPPGAPRKKIENAVIWLVLVESLCLPHLLWIASTRYRHAFVYIWRVRVLRRPAEEEEDPAACTLKSYLRTAQQLNGTGTRPVPSGSLPRQHTEEVIQTGRHPHNNRQLPLTDIGTIVRQQNQRCRQRPDNSIDAQSTAYATKSGTLHQQMSTPSPNIQPAQRASSTISSRTSPSQKHSSGHIQNDNTVTCLEATRELDLMRSASASSRHDWKEQMRKKHLPPIFVNEAFDSGEANRARNMGQVATHAHAREDSSSLHFYLSGDYHPDYLNTDSLPRKRHLLKERSESEGVSGQYDEGDIEMILDENHSSTNVEVHNTRPHLSSFKSIQLKKHSRSSSLGRDSDGDNLSNVNLPDVISNGLKSSDNSDHENDVVQNPYLQHVRKSSHSSSHVQSECSGSHASFDDVDVSDLLGDSSRTVDGHSCRIDGDGDARAGLYKAEELAIDLTYSEPSHIEINDGIARVISPHPEGKETPNDNFPNRNLSDSSSRASSYFSRENKQMPTFDHSGCMSSSYQNKTDNRISRVYMAECSDRRSIESPRSNTSTPLSFTFDPEIDRGFEEALSVGCPGTPSVCGTIPGFDSVTEGSEDGSSVFPVDCNISLEEDPFRTHAVVSKSLSDTRSTGSSENPFDFLPSLKYGNTYPNKYSELIDKASCSPVSDIMVNSTSETDHGDSGFNSGLESSVLFHQGSNLVLAGGSHDDARARQNSSPWPEDVSVWPNDESNTQHGFENDFSGNVPHDVSSGLNTRDSEAVYF